MIATLLLGTGTFAQQTLGEVIGQVVDFSTQSPVPDATITIEDNGRKYNARTGLDGRFRISAIPSGTYLVNVRYMEDTVKNIVAEVPMDGFANIGVVKLGSKINTQDLDDIIVSAKGERLKLIDGNLPVASLTSIEIDKSPAKFNINDLVTSMSSEVRKTEDGELVFRGARKGDMIYLIDGVKTRDAGSLPGVSIGRMQVYTGGLPAKYGDTLGGVVVIESKSYFDLYRSWESDQIRKGLR